MYQYVIQLKLMANCRSGHHQHKHIVNNLYLLLNLTRGEAEYTMTMYQDATNYVIYIEGIIFLLTVLVNTLVFSFNMVIMKFNHKVLMSSHLKCHFLGILLVTLS
jgi:hypothetical protein